MANSKETATFQEKEITKFSKRDGWAGTTEVKVNGRNWVITTRKWSRGIATHCRAVNDEGGGSYSFSIFTNNKDEDFYLNQQDKSVMATESKIREIHFKSLSDFDTLQQSKHIPEKKVIGVGQIIFTDMIQSYNESRKRVIYEVVRDGHYKTVLLDGSDISQDDYVRPYSEKFGIGVYYNEGEVLDQDTINDLLITAHQKIKDRNERQEQERLQSNQDRENKIALGAKVLPELPKGIVSIIVAENHTNESDSQSDYFASSIGQTVYLAFSNHKRDVFSEMKKAAENFEPTKYLSTKGDEYENRQKYSMGKGYWLGEHTYSGWQVKKDSYFQPQNLLEKLQVAISEGRYMIPTAGEGSGVKSENLEIRYNEEKKGIELLFPSKPEASVLTAIKLQGFKWSNFSKLWYAKDTEENRNFVKTLL